MVACKDPLPQVCMVCCPVVYMCLLIHLFLPLQVIYETCLLTPSRMQKAALGLQSSALEMLTGTLAPLLGILGTALTLQHNVQTVIDLTHTGEKDYITFAMLT